MVSKIAENLKQVKYGKGPKWTLKKLAMGQYLSETCYYTVDKILKDKVHVRNQRGSEIVLSKYHLDDMYSADHYVREVALSMTGLAELL